MQKPSYSAHSFSVISLTDRVREVEAGLEHGVLGGARAVAQIVPIAALLFALFVLQGVVPIYGTIWILLLVFVIARLSYATRMTNSTLIQIHKDLEEAAMVSGASTIATLYRVIIPLLAPVAGEAGVAAAEVPGVEVSGAGAPAVSAPGEGVSGADVSAAGMPAVAAEKEAPVATGAAASL